MSTIMHVGIENPKNLRKEILSSAVDTVQALKEFEIHKKVNKEKGIYRKHFIQIIKELSLSIHELQEMMPIIHVAQPHEQEPEKVVPAPKVQKPVIKKPVRKKNKELDKLESDISNLKDKIASL